MNILLLGSGGREHAYALYLSRSKKVSHLYIAPGNGGTDNCGTNINLNPLDFDSVNEFCLTHAVDVILPGNEDPLVAGIVDYFAEKNPSIKVAGPSKWCAQLEGSKSFSKKFMESHSIPTAAYKEVNQKNIVEGEQFLEKLTPPYVLKADGLAAGKGVLILDNLMEAKQELKLMIEEAKFGAASSTVVIEEFLKGIELSVFVVSDGETWKLLGSAKDYKRIGEGDTGLNTGGMGAISPVPFANDEFMKKVEQQVIVPTLDGLRSEGHPYKGILFIGLMNDAGNPSVVEYNVRMGDPETEAIFPRLKTDMGELIAAVVEGNLKEVELTYDERVAASVFLVSQGYPEAYEKGKEISIPSIENNVVLLQAGTKQQNNHLITNGGRVLSVTALEDTMQKAIDAAMKTAEKVTFTGKTYRRDIGQDLLKLKNG